MSQGEEGLEESPVIHIESGHEKAFSSLDVF